jgi:DNA-binding NtrC family response regulator
MEFGSDTDKPCRVLLVEDEPRLRDLLLRAIPDMGFTPLGARSGEEGLKQMEAQPCEIIVLDLNLPGMTGLEFLEAVRKRWPKAAVVILTGFGDLDAARKAIRLDVVDFLTKPCPLGELEVALERARRRVRGEPGAVSEALRAALAGHSDEDEDAPDAPGSAAAPHFGSDAPGSAPGSAAPSAANPAGPHKLDEFERQHILSALQRHGGNRTATAQELGISLRTLYYRLSEYQKREPEK